MSIAHKQLLLWAYRRVENPWGADDELGDCNNSGRNGSQWLRTARGLSTGMEWMIIHECTYLRIR